jgi:hypothetical protein
MLPFGVRGMDVEDEIAAGLGDVVVELEREPQPDQVNSSGAHLLAHVRPGHCQAQGAPVPFEQVKRHVVFDETFGDEVSSPPLQRVNRGEEFEAQLLAPGDGRQPRDSPRNGGDGCWALGIHGQLRECPTLHLKSTVPVQRPWG